MEMHDETAADLARVLSFAATYMEEHGRARFSFGGRPGGPLCPAAAIALALGYNPGALGRGWLFLPNGEAHRGVGTVILRAGLLNALPVPQRQGSRRKTRPARMSPYRAVKELARWSDDKLLDALVIGALRGCAERLGQNLTGRAGNSSGARLLLPALRVDAEDDQPELER